LLQLLAARMPGHMHECVRIGDHLAAEINEPILNLANGALVSRNGPRGKDHQIPGVELHVRMLVGGNARKRRAWFALAAGTQRENLARLKIRKPALVLVLKIWWQISALDRDLDHAMHGSARDNKAAPRRASGVGYGSNARYVGRKYRH